MRHGDLYSCRLRQELCPFGGEPCTRVWEVALLITLGCCKNHKGQQDPPQTGCQWVARLSNTNGLLLLFGFSVLQFLGIGWGKAGWPSPIHRAVLCGQEAVVPSRSTLGPSEYLTSLWKPHGRGLKLWVRMRTSCSEQPQSQVLRQQALARRSGSRPLRCLPQVDGQVTQPGQEACLICCLPRGPGEHSWIIMVMREPAALCLSQLGSLLLGTALLWQWSNILHDWKGKGARCRKSRPAQPCKWGGKAGGGLPVGEEGKFIRERVI